MHDLHLDVRAGVTGPALLGAFVEAGASVERIEQVVASLGNGAVRITVSATTTGTQVRVRAPEGSPDVETWAQLRPRVALLATDEAVAEQAVAILDALFEGRGTVHRVAAADVDLDPFSVLDDVACALALATALVDLAPTTVTCTSVGHGQGDLETLEGRVAMPGPVVAAILSPLMTHALDVTAELVDPVGAAFLAAVATQAPDADLTATVGPGGHGRLPPAAGGRSVTATLHGATAHAA